MITIWNFLWKSTYDLIFYFSSGHQEILRAEGKCTRFDPVPLVLVKDIMNYMPQMKYMFANVASTNSDPAAKRMKLSWPELLSPSSIGSGIPASGGVAGNGSEPHYYSPPTGSAAAAAAAADFRQIAEAIETGLRSTSYYSDYNYLQN